MVAFFRNNILTISLMLLPYALIIRIKSLISPIAYISTPEDSPLFNNFISFFDSPTSQSIIAILLVFIQGVMINRLIIKNRICHEQSLVPGLFYVLFASMLPGFLTLSPELVSLTFITSAFIQLFMVYGKIKKYIHIFNVGVLLSIASLIYYPSILFVIVAILGFIMLRSINIRGLLQLLVGVLFPYYLLYVYYYINNNSEIFYHYTRDNFIWKNSLGVLAGDYYTIIIIAILTIISVFLYRPFTKTKSIQTQEKIELLYLHLILFLISSILIKGYQEVYLLYTILPIAIFFTLWILKLKNTILIELIHMGLIVILFSIHFIL